MAEPLRGERLMTPQEVAGRLRVSVKTVYNMAAESEIPPHRIRGSLRFDAADIDDYIFFSKFRGGDIRYSPSDIKGVFERVNDQIEQAKRYMETFLASKSSKKEVAMKK
jgi:excisionase family DNA binding protein